MVKTRLRDFGIRIWHKTFLKTLQKLMWWGKTESCKFSLKKTSLLNPKKTSKKNPNSNLRCIFILNLQNFEDIYPKGCLTFPDICSKKPPVPLPRHCFTRIACWSTTSVAWDGMESWRHVKRNKVHEKSAPPPDIGFSRNLRGDQLPQSIFFSNFGIPCHVPGCTLPFYLSVLVLPYWEISHFWQCFVFFASWPIWPGPCTCPTADDMKWN